MGILLNDKRKMIVINYLIILVKNFHFDFFNIKLIEHFKKKCTFVIRYEAIFKENIGNCFGICSVVFYYVIYHQ